MKSSHYLAIAVRLFAIAIFIYGLRQSTMLVEVLIRGSINDMNVSVIFMLAATLFPLVGAIFLWYFPFSVTSSILKPEIDQPVEPMDAQSVLTVLILAIGLVALYNAFVDSMFWLTLWHMSEQSMDSSVQLSLNSENKSNMVTTAIELGVSIAILLKAKSLSCRMLRLTE